MSEFLEDIEFSFEGSRLYYAHKVLECKADIVDICLGQYGDGCGGGRVFILYTSEIEVYDLESEGLIELEVDFKDAKNMYKKACELFITSKDEEIVFNLSTMTQTTLALREPSSNY